MECLLQLPQVFRIEYSCRYPFYRHHLYAPLAGPLMQQLPRHLVDNVACSSPDDHQHFTTRPHSNMPKIQKLARQNIPFFNCHVNTGLEPAPIGHSKSQPCKNPGKVWPYQHLIYSVIIHSCRPKKAGFIADFNAMLNSTFEQPLTHYSAGFKDIKPLARIIE